MNQETSSQHKVIDISVELIVQSIHKVKGKASRVDHVETEHLVHA